MSEQISNANEDATKQKSCSYKGILGCICLVTILTVFCIVELIIMCGIFIIFASFYVAIIVLGSIYLTYLAITKASRNCKNKNTNKT